MKRVLLLITALLLLAGCKEKEKIIITMPTLAEFPTAIPTSTFTPTATISPTPSLIPSATITPTPTLTLAPSITPSPILTATPTIFEGLSSQIDRAGLMRVIGDMQNFGSRHVNAINRDGMTGIDAARQYLLNQLNSRASTCAVPARVLEDTFTVRFDGERTQQANLVAEVPGTQLDNGVIIIGGHYDTIHGAEPEDEDIDQPGADDNGSGVAAILELMRLICMTPHQHTFVFVLFSAEEPDEGRLGSRSFVQDFIPTTSWRVDAMLNLDTIGSSTDERGAIKDDFARLYSSGPISCCARQLARNIQAAAFVQLPDFRLNVEDSIDRLFRWGDHMSFTEMNYPAVRLFEGSEDVVRQDTQRDLINDIDPTYLEKNIQVVLAYLLGVSDGIVPPQNLIVNGTTATWTAVPGAQAYLVVQRPPNESNYVVMTQVNDTSVTLPAETIFAVGSIGANGLLGVLGEENYIAP